MNLDMSNHSNSGLLRFRSAPSSLFSDFSNGVDKGSDLNEGLTSRFSPVGNIHHGNNHSGNLISQSFQDLLKEEKCLVNGYSLNSVSQLPPHYPRQPSNSASMEEGSFRVVSSMGMENHAQSNMGSGLMRQSSSPPGFLSQLSPQNGYGGIRGAYRVGNGGANGELSPSLGRLNGQMNFSSGVPSSLRILSRISEIDPESIIANVPDSPKLGNRNGESHFYPSDYPFGSWNDSAHFNEPFVGPKREIESDVELLVGSQNEELGNRLPVLTHHLSMPNTSGEMAVVGKLLRFQDSVPCKMRAKRGCATHPRSIAERERRTRISVRMRKLQDLVPNMDKQTNTADMLDLAVEYIKDLQNQYKTLSDLRSNCKCSGVHKLVSN